MSLVLQVGVLIRFQVCSFCRIKVAAKQRLHNSTVSYNNVLYSFKRRGRLLKGGITSKLVSIKNLKRQNQIRMLFYNFSLFQINWCQSVELLDSKAVTEFYLTKGVR